MIIQIHELLKQLLGDNYNPMKHWTSKNRTISGFSVFDENNHASFTLPDPSGTFTAFLMYAGNPEAAAWESRPPTYHLEVKSTLGGLHSNFVFETAEFSRARKFTASESANGKVADVSILVRVVNVRDKPQQFFFADPWEWYMSDKLEMEARDGFKACLKK